MSTLVPTTSTVLPLETTSLFIGRCSPNQVGCGRIITVGEWISLGIASAAFIFHITMCAFIVCQITVGDQLFSSAFYKLYAVLSIMEILHAVLVRRSRITAQHGVHIGLPCFGPLVVIATLNRSVVVHFCRYASITVP